MMMRELLIWRIYKMVKFIHTSDWHLGRRNYNSEERYRDNFRVIYRMIQQIKDMDGEDRPDFIFHTGDVFHNQNVDSNTFNYAIKIFQEFQKMEIPVYVIRGNHDADEEKYTNTFLHALEQVNLIKVVSTSLDPTKSIFEPLPGVRLYGVGHRYSSYKERLEEIIQSHPIEPDNVNILGLHTSVSGLDGSDSRSTIPGAIDFSANYLLDLDFHYIALGHHHGRSIYQPKRNGSTIAYSGSPEHWNNANWDKDGINDKKYVLFVDINNGKVNVTEIELKVRPKIYIQKEYHELDGAKAIDEIMELLENKNKEFESLVPLSIDSSKRIRYLPIINFHFTIGFHEEEFDYPFDRLKFRLENILHPASSIRIEPIHEDQKIEFFNEDDLYTKIIGNLYPENTEKVTDLLERSLRKRESLIEVTGSVNKAESELEEYLWRSYMEEAT
ncbi:MAG: DNA double-strand break repair protein Mre11 [Candidatus Heimdallarchaeota archaeon LC_2]|nr:MAG: DNA double-strand break repair protein Mre11 [Candidatus Heimdallarchaeota archaeon LC_2]